VPFVIDFVLLTKEENNLLESAFGEVNIISKG
jgi:hypothetical protein